MMKQWLIKKMPLFSLISLQFLYASMSLATKATIDKGFSPIIFLVYRQTASSVLLMPVSIITTWRKPTEKKMGVKGFFLVFMAALIGVTMTTNFYFEGMKLASASVASAMYNLIPAETFLIAVAVGLEKVKLGNIRSLAKVLGTIICVCGVLVMLLFKGQKLLNASFLQGGEGNKWLLGCLLLIASSSCWATWLILQVPICRNHLDPLSLSAMMSVISAMQTAILALFIEPDWSVWRADSGSLLFCFYTGFCCAVSYFVQAWSIGIKGPLFSAMFSPLFTVITSISASLLLNEELYIGSLAGAAAIAAGLYVVLWGKAGDIKKPEKLSENNLEEPLITSSNDEH